MIRKLLVFSAAAASVVFFAALLTSGSQAATADVVLVQVEARKVDGAVLFSTADGWSWRCTGTPCTVRVARGTVLTIVAEDGATARFLRWEGACGSSGTGKTCTIAAGLDIAYVAARFSQPQLWLAAFGRGSIVVESASPGVAPAWRSCGTDCREYAYGEALRLRAVPSNTNHRMTAWGGACAPRVSANSACLLTMRKNYLVSATFEENLPPRKCEPGKSCDPVGSAIRFTVAVKGRGTVEAPRMRNLQGMSCRSFCDLYRLAESDVELTAVPSEGRPFLRWGGRCSRFGKARTCTFKNKGTSRIKNIEALFGS
jgi:hypothetical protein